MKRHRAEPPTQPKMGVTASHDDLRRLTADPEHRIEFWLDLPQQKASDVDALRVERARLCKTARRRWARAHGLEERDVCVIQGTPEVFARHDGAIASVRFWFAVGPDLSRLGARLGSVGTG